MTAAPVRLGLDAVVVAERADGLELESPLRLAPGRVVVLAGETRSAGPDRRRAVVWSWTLDRLGRQGAMYRGVCLWLAVPREPTTP